MRVLIPNHFPLEGSGSGIYAQNVAREVVKAGHEALAIVPDHEPVTGFPFPVRTILFTPEDEDPGDRLPFNFPCFTTHPKSHVQFGDLDADQRAAYVAAFHQTIQAAVDEWRPDVIHANHLWVTAYVTAQVGVPYVATTHGTDLMGFRKYEAYRKIAREGAHDAHAIIAISRQVMRDAQELYRLPDDRLRLIWNGFPDAIFKVMPGLDRAKVLRSHGLPENPTYIVTFVGKFTDFKGIDVLIDAAATYEKELGDVITVMMGDGELRPQIEAQAANLGLKGVYFLGHTPQPEVAKLYNLADCSTVPSRIEPFGLVAIEALACGTPVVATNAGGLPDFISNEVGTLVPMDDPPVLAQAIVEQVRGGAKQTKGPYCAEYALGGFSWRGQVGKMIALYEEAIQAAAGK
jgi:glycosyltransferase involved in cell wall biosynthesis